MLSVGWLQELILWFLRVNLADDFTMSNEITNWSSVVAKERN